ncbi:MAG TPA: methyltransferase domain-containing protein [Bryobacteraceae bacterium]|nr:methyltransferase domain-containing protein [Bryobacteraceae bacterium]
MRRFRARRMREFVARFGVSSETRILDVGGTPANWMLTDVRPRVTLLNMPRGQERDESGFTFVSGDGCQLPFADQSFEIVFSNSVIEHVGARAMQRRFAEEVRRVGKRYWVQTPNYWFPLEPHLLTPFVHWLPKDIQRSWVTRWTVWDLVERPSLDRREFYIRHFLEDIRLLSASELAELFPDADIVRERSLGLTKSLIACSARTPACRVATPGDARD